MTMDYSFNPNQNLLSRRCPDGSKIIALWNDAEGWGELTVLSGRGNYAHRWEATGGRFDAILRADADYLMEKLLQNHDEGFVLCPEDTRNTILNDLELEDVDALSGLRLCDTETDFVLWAQKWSTPEIHRYFVYGIGQQAQYVRDYIMPHVRAMSEHIGSVSGVMDTLHNG